MGNTAWNFDFKFQSDSINTSFASRKDSFEKSSFKFQSDSINTPHMQEIVMVKCVFKFQSDSINTPSRPYRQKLS